MDRTVVKVSEDHTEVQLDLKLMVYGKGGDAEA